MSSDDDAPRFQALAVNVSRRWSEVGSGISTEADVVLSAWSPWQGRSTTKMLFDPDRIAVVVACRGGKTMAVYDVLPDADGNRWHWVGDGPRPRVAFHGRPSRRFAAQLGAPGRSWKPGEGTPVKVMELDDLLQGDLPADTTARQAVVGQAVVSIDGERHLTVSVPADYSVTIDIRSNPATVADRSS
ncbi:hypothetical protein ACH4PU_31290 [Streptomyces sp. NPDC021100]|uniref:hypothetical protein n=1 Tax=Streptomyces sp. NPDC021100 TaxID=3365114 RepID=UPI00379CCA27